MREISAKLEICSFYKDICAKIKVKLIYFISQVQCSDRDSFSRVYIYRDTSARLALLAGRQAAQAAFRALERRNSPSHTESHRPGNLISLSNSLPGRAPQSTGECESDRLRRLARESELVGSLVESRFGYLASGDSVREGEWVEAPGPGDAVRGRLDLGAWATGLSERPLGLGERGRVDWGA